MEYLRQLVHWARQWFARHGAISMILGPFSAGAVAMIYNVGVKAAAVRESLTDIWALAADVPGWPSTVAGAGGLVNACLPVVELGYCIMITLSVVSLCLIYTVAMWVVRRVVDLVDVVPFA